MTINFEKLSEPFPAEDIEWRISRGGKKKDGSLWAKCLAYITNRAIMERLDAVVGPENWRNEFREWHGDDQLCGISIRIDGEWITKWDGAQQTETEGTKGGISGAMKRAAVQWGIGRYLYKLTENWVDIVDNGGEFYNRINVGTKQKPEYENIKWNPPGLPHWALPAGTNGKSKPPTNQKPDTVDTTGYSARLQDAVAMHNVDKVFAIASELSALGKEKKITKDQWLAWQGKVFTFMDQILMGAGVEEVGTLRDMMTELFERSKGDEPTLITQQQHTAYGAKVGARLETLTQGSPAESAA